MFQGDLPRLSLEDLNRIELEGLTEDELRGAIYALDAVQRMARIIQPRVETHSALARQLVPASKVLSQRAELTITVAQATLRTLPFGHRTHGMTASRQH